MRIFESGRFLNFVVRSSSSLTPGTSTNEPVFSRFPQVRAVRGISKSTHKKVTYLIGVPRTLAHLDRGKGGKLIVFPHSSVARSLLFELRRMYGLRFRTA